MSMKNCLRCGCPVSDEAGACPQCGLNFSRIKKETEAFLPQNRLHRKIQAAVAVLQSRRVTRREFQKRLESESGLVDTLLEKYRGVESPDLASAASLFVQALQIYREAIHTLSEDSQKSLDLAREADEILFQVDSAAEKFEFQCPDPSR